MNHNPREPQAELGPGHVRAALHLMRPPTRTTTPALAALEARRARSCPHCHAPKDDPCTVLATGRVLSDGKVHPARLEPSDIRAKTLTGDVTPPDDRSTP